ncbi:hypothetical protein AB0P15_29645 [Streptomyces sp. NPDC087917]|uniref:hypothetical protein n=1 Tax=Streptomyces sp. NPDC087917 TaxID=3155060 RepID=UPI00342A5DF8
MNDQEQRKPTPPSEAPGESGDREARQEAQDAVVPGAHDDEGGDASPSSTDAQRRADKPKKGDGRHE